MIEKIKAITDVEGFVLNAQAIVDILKVILEEIFAFIGESEGWVEAAE